jgi:hypothetical protein
MNLFVLNVKRKKLMCEHIWQRLCKNGQGACPFCDKCKLCGIKLIDAVQEKVNE